MASSFFCWCRRAFSIDIYWLYRIDRKTGQVEEVFLSDGGDLSGSSVSARYRKRLLIGAVFDDKFFDCQLN
jgi:hypothetical protein